MAAQALPYAHLGDALATDYFQVREQFTDEQWEHFIATRRFVDREVLPVINEYWEAAELPWPLMRRLAELGLLGEDIEGYGCPGMSPLARGLVNMELHRGDGSLGTFLGVQSGLAMKSIDLLGSEEQKERWLPAMARLEAIGAFALTEPEHGSDSVALETSARRDGDALGARRRQALDRQRLDRRRRRRVGALRRGRPGQGLPGREGHARLRGRHDGGQGRVARDLAGRDPPRRRAGARGVAAARRRDVQGRRPRARHHPHDVRLGRAGPRRRGLRRGPDLQQAAQAVRQAAVLVPDRSGPAREDARRGHRHAALLHAARPPGGRSAGSRTRSPGWPSSTTRARPARSSPTRATCSAATASCSRTTSSATWATSRSSTPTRAPRPCRR